MDEGQEVGFVSFFEREEILLQPEDQDQAGCEEKSVGGELEAGVSARWTVSLVEERTRESQGVERPARSKAARKCADDKHQTHPRSLRSGTEHFREHGESDVASERKCDRDQSESDEKSGSMEKRK